MPKAAIPFTASQETGASQLNGALPLAVNCWVDGAGAVRARPGITTWSNFPTAIPNASAVIGMAPWSANNYLVYVTADRKLFDLHSSGFVVARSDSAAATQLDGSLRPTFFTGRTMVIVTGGGLPQKWDGSTLSARLGGSPPVAHSVASVSARAVLGINDVSGRIQWSGLGDTALETWDALNYSEAYGRNDPTSYIADNTAEVFVWGTQTLQVYQPDPSQGFAQGRALNIGTYSPFSVVRVDENFVFFDSERRMLITNGRTWQDLAPNLNETFDSLSSVDDCWGLRVVTGQLDGVLFTFPTDQRSFFWEREGGRWSEWRGFSSGAYTAFAATAGFFWPETSTVLIGQSDGSIKKLSFAANDDSGEVIKVEIQTGAVDHETFSLKICEAVRFKFKQGVGTATVANPVVMLSWRDDSSNTWTTPVSLPLGAAGTYGFDVQLRSLGTYRSRQWRLEMTDAVEFVFLGAEEEFSVLQA